MSFFLPERRKGARRVIVCAGMPRSGSTWLFNAIRLLLLEVKSPDDVYGAWVEMYVRSHRGTYHVVKTHGFISSLANNAWRVFTSRRDLRDIAASLVLKRWASRRSLIRALDAAVRSHSAWRRHSSYEMVYEELVTSPIEQLARIAATLEIEPSPDLLRRVQTRLDSLQPVAGVPPERSPNLLHPGHRQRGECGYYLEVLDRDLVSKIERTFRPWLSEYRYPTSRGGRAAIGEILMVRCQILGYRAVSQVRRWALRARAHVRDRLSCSLR